MKAIWITAVVIIVTILIIVVGFYAAKSLMPPNPNVGDATKLERTFTQEEVAIIKDRNFTMEEVAEHDGADGKGAYIVVNDVVYDVSNIPSWVRGMHHGVKAGTDATDQFVNSIHDSKTLEKLTVVGGVEP